MSQGRVIIVGAGLLGLSCAVQLSLHGYQVTVIARDLPGDSAIDYASPWAGAHFRPSPARTSAEQLEQQFMQETYREFETIANKYPEAGVQFIPAIEYFDSADPDSFLAKENGYIDWPGFRTLAANEDPQDHASIQLGVSYRAWVLNSPVYLQWLQRRAEHQGVTFLRAQVMDMEDAIAIFQQNTSRNQDGAHIHAVVDASGRGLNEPDSFPSRGQFIVVSNRYDKTVSHHWADGSSTVIIPRPLNGGTVIGGTKEPGNWSEEISDSATETILKRVAGICPELVDQKIEASDKVHGFDIHQVYVARRPMRLGGLRVEKERHPRTDRSDGLDVPLVHCYGAGASGYKISWGVANRVVHLVAGINGGLES